MAQQPQPPQQPQGILSFLGCKISLVSKSEIRYEGTLYTIDSKQGTVALEKVRMLGTEGRRADRQVAPSQEIYEYIIFRASDIKDLHVCEPPPPPPQPQVQVAPAVDPAVVSAVSQPYNPYAQPPQPQPQQQQQQQQAYSPFYGGLPQQHQQHPQLPPPSTVFAAPAPAPVASAAAAEAAPAAQAPAPARKPLEIVRKPVQQQQQQQQTAEQPEATTAAAAAAPVQQPEQAQDAQQQQQQQQPPMTRGWLGGRGRRMQGPGQQQQQQSAFAGPAVTRDQLDEFDFASSNSKFDREKLRQEVETTTGGNTPAPAYDRSRSFFDSLVPSPSRPQRERPMHIEAASETFGAGAVPVYNRRGGRGGGGRGGRRGQQFFAQPGMQQQQQRYNYHFQRPMQHQQRQQQQQSSPLLTPVAAPAPTQQPQQQ